MLSSSNFFDAVSFPLSSLVTGPSFMSMSSLVLELWQFSFIRDWPEIWKSEIHPSELCPIYVDWSKLRIPNLARIFLTKSTECCKMLGLQLLLFLSYQGKPTGRRGMGGGWLPSPFRLGLSNWWHFSVLNCTPESVHWCFFSKIGFDISQSSSVSMIICSDNMNHCTFKVLIIFFLLQGQWNTIKITVKSFQPK